MDDPRYVRWAIDRTPALANEVVGTEAVAQGVAAWVRESIRTRTDPAGLERYRQACPVRAMPPEAEDRSEPIVASHHSVVQGLRCHHLEAGDGPPLVLLHGTAFDSAALSFGASMAALAQRHRVLALDWPGYGESEVPRATMSMDDYVDLLDAFLEAHGVERAHLAGFSMGGAVALGYALGRARRVASLTMIGSYGLDARMPVPLVAYLAMRVPLLQRGVVSSLRRSKALTHLVLGRLVFADRRLVTAALVEDVHRQLSAAEAERSFVAWLRGELGPFRLATSYADRLGDVAVPTLLLHGRRDLVVPWRKANAAHGRLPNSRLVVVPRCGHWVMREAPDVFEDTLREFIAQHA